MSKRTSFDKVISYDATSLVSSHERLDTENDKSASSKDLAARRRSMQRQMAVQSHLLSPEHQMTQMSVNEEFNQKLVQYGTENGVPSHELPDALPTEISRNRKESMV